MVGINNPVNADESYLFQESRLNGAAMIDEKSEEIPITETMIQSALAKLEKTPKNKKLS